MDIRRNILSKEELIFVQEELNKDHWGFGYVSGNPDTLQYTSNKEIWNYNKESGRKAAELLASKFNYELIDWHINGQTINQSAGIHNDLYGGTTKAVVFFPFEWDFTWGGRLCIKDTNGVMIITPEMNLGVIFDPKLEHYAEGPVVNKLRISIGLKLK